MLSVADVRALRAGLARKARQSPVALMQACYAHFHISTAPQFKKAHQKAFGNTLRVAGIYEIRQRVDAASTMLAFDFEAGIFNFLAGTIESVQGGAPCIPIKAARMRRATDGAPLL